MIQSLLASLLRRRARAFTEGRRARRKVAACVIGVGNLTAGGTGKTPTVIDLARRLAASGVRVGIASRGHGGQERGPLLVRDRDPDPAAIGDEPALIVRRLPGVPVAIGRDRAAACDALIRESGAQVILLDDGFSHHRLARDADLVLINGPRGMGNGRLLPLGPLREPLDALDRAAALVITKGPLDPRWVDRLHPWLTSRPVFSWTYRLEALERLVDRTGIDCSALASGGRVVAASALGDNRSFGEFLAALGIDAVPVAFGDHQPLAPRWRRIERAVRDSGAQWVVITEKDEVKWPVDFRPPNLVVARVGLAWSDEEAVLRWIERRVDERDPG